MSTLVGENFEENGQLKNIDWQHVESSVYWLRDDPILTFTVGFYVVVTGEIERFTVLNIKSYIPQLQSQISKKEIEKFIREEIRHAHVHSQVSQHLEKNFFPSKLLHKYAKGFFKVCSKIMGIKSSAGLILGMEFYAHSLAVFALKYNFFPNKHNEIFDFLRWHSIEELPHIDLCYEIYQKLGGGYIRRCFSLTLFTLFICSVILLFLPLCFYLLLRKGISLKLKKSLKTLVMGVCYRGFVWSFLPTYFQFFKPTWTPSRVASKPIETENFCQKRKRNNFESLAEAIMLRHNKQVEIYNRDVQWGYWENHNVEQVSDNDYLLAGEKLFDKVIDSSKISNGHAVLDVGSGNGKLLSKVNQKYSAIKSIGINTFTSQAKNATNLTSAKYYSSPYFITADPCHIPLQDETYDRIIAHQNIHKFTSREGFFREACRLLKPGGTLTITDFVPHAFFFFNAWYMSTKLFSWFNFLGAGDVSYTIRGYKKIATKFNLEMSFEDISHNTLPIYTYFWQVLNEEKTSSPYTRFMRLGVPSMTFLTKSRLFSYKILTFRKKTHK